MPWSGNGTFSRVYSWVTDQANGVLVRADRTDTDSNDIAAGITNCIARDGQASPTANIPFAGYKITGLGSGAAIADAVNFGQVFNSPTFTAPSAATSPAQSDNSTLLATTFYVNQKAFASALPVQPSDGLTYRLTSTASVASWSTDVPNAASYLFLNSNLGGF